MIGRRSSRFSNPWVTRPPPGHNNVLRWALAHRFRRPPDAEWVIETAIPSFAMPAARRDELTVTWIGHSTALVQIGGLNVLTDPVWSERASPVSFAGPRRRLPPALELGALPPIDVVLISHDHYDHLDVNTVGRLAAARADTRWLVPLGVGSHVRDAGARQVDELAWWDERVIGSVSLVCTPAQHSSGRGVADRNRSLWCGWCVATTTVPRRAIYFAGDSAYCPAFLEIGTRLGPFDACLLPIGGYEPRWYMRYVHMTPEEAVRAFEDLCRGSITESSLIPIHWGTFRIADDALDEPPKRLLAEWRAARFPEASLAMLAHGETRRWPRMLPHGSCSA
jgi:N-acyl-phosphatidylethanolamine-hydrolysing phospholipase D